MSILPKFSIIVPVYKAESFIQKCIEGIIAQTVTDFELILVNDGSPDNSGEICNEYAQKDKRIKVLHKKNGGPSSARNIGLDKATGEIICFVDSDDYVMPQFLENFGECSSDITIQGIYAKRPNEEGYQYCCIYERKFNKDYIKDIVDTVYKSRNTGYLVTRAFKRKIIEDHALRLNINYHLREDEEFIWRYMCKCQTFETINKGAYHYEMPDFTSKYSFTYLDTDNECTISIIESIKSLLGDYNHPYIVNNINRLASNILNSYHKRDYNTTNTKKYIQQFKKYYRKVRGNKFLSFKSKIIYYLIGTYTPDYMHKLYHYILSK